MNPDILKPDPAAETYTPERCFILELSNSSRDGEVSIARARVLPGVTTQLHRLEGVAERYVILAGEGAMEVGDRAPSTVGAGDVVLVPAGVKQRIRNTGRDDLIFLCVCTPPFVPTSYQSLEDGSANQSLGTRKSR